MLSSATPPAGFTTRKTSWNELGKISRVIDRELPGCDRETLLVLDAATGQNAVNQAREFQSAAGITGIVLTKLDGTPKGGVVLPIMQDLGLPVKFIGVGEQVDDLQPFDRMPLPMPCLTTSGTTPPSLPKIGRLPQLEEQRQEEEVLQEQDQAGEDAWRARSCSSSWRSAPSPRRACSPISTPCWRSPGRRSLRKNWKNPSRRRKSARFWPFGRKRDEE